jgi:hypothetical protein
MADIVNPQITDAVATTEAPVSGSANALSNLYQSHAHSLALAAQNAASNQQNMNAVLQAATAQGIALLLAA